ncbi:Fic family protein [Rhizobium halophytocola]
MVHDDQSRLPALIKAGLPHMQFATIHPLPDGNGRIGQPAGSPTFLHERRFAKAASIAQSLLSRRSKLGSLAGVFLAGVADIANQAFEAATQIVDLFEDREWIVGVHVKCQ